MGIVNAQCAGATTTMSRPWVFLCMLAALCAVRAAQAQEAWMLLSRETGCSGLELLVKMERLAQVPRSPDDFAAMMRARGHAVIPVRPDSF